MTVQRLTISFALNILQHVIHLFLLRCKVFAFWLANGPGVAGVDHVVILSLFALSHRSFFQGGLDIRQ